MQKLPADYKELESTVLDLRTKPRQSAIHVTNVFVRIFLLVSSMCRE